MIRSCFRHAWSAMRFSEKVLIVRLSFWKRLLHCWMGNIVQPFGRVRQFQSGSRGSRRLLHCHLYELPAFIPGTEREGARARGAAHTVCSLPNGVDIFYRRAKVVIALSAADTPRAGSLGRREIEECFGGGINYFWRSNPKYKGCRVCGNSPVLSLLSE